MFLRISASFLAIAFAGSAQCVTISVTNNSKDDWADAPIVVEWKNATQKPGSVKDGEERLEVQVDDLDGDGKIDELFFVAPLKAGETKKFQVDAEPPTTSTEPRAHTGMYLKSATSKGFEGPGWESDRIAYRIYWDARNATDVFAKTQPILSLKEYAKPGLNYHRLSKWGMDVLKVRTAVGIGGFGAFVNGKVEKVAQAKRTFKVVADGPLRAICDLIYTDWETSTTKMNLTARMTICAGQSWAECKLTAKSLDDKPVPELIAGFVKLEEETTLVQDPRLAYVGRWGNQALGEGEVLKGGNLGLGIMADPYAIAEIGEDDVNHYFRLKPENGEATYRYIANWYKEPGAAKSADEFEEMMKKAMAVRPVVKVDKQEGQ